MADEVRAPDPRTPPPPPDPRRGNLRVSGAPQKPPMIPWSPRRFIAILLGLFVLNWLIVAVFAPPENKIKVPYNPTFLDQVRGGNVEEISASTLKVVLVWRSVLANTRIRRPGVCDSVTPRA